MVTITSTRLLKNKLKNFLHNNNVKKFLIAFSGGIDSTVLFHALNDLKEEHKISIRCIHINHHLNNYSDEYYKHCIKFFKKYKAQYITGDIYIDDHSNIEEKLREERYKIITETVHADEYILTAHHLDDQIETFFLRLMRGSSPTGLSCMDTISYINSKPVARPLIEIDKSIIRDYLDENNLEYIEDITNNSNEFDRNYIRNKIVPLFKKRWKGLNKTMLNNINQQKIYSYLTREYIQSKLLKLYNNNNSHELLSAKLLDENIHTQASLLHEWIRSKANLSLYNNQIQEILKSVVNARNDSYPLFEYRTIKITKSDNIIYLTKQKSVDS